MSTPGSSRPNSSPPSRATVSDSRSAASRRCPTSISSASPAAWPSESLISLKRSRSITTTASCLPSRRAVRISRSMRSPKSVRLARPVRPSWSAWYSLSSDCASSACSALRRCVTSWTTPIVNDSSTLSPRTSESETIRPHDRAVATHEPVLGPHRRVAALGHPRERRPRRLLVLGRREVGDLAAAQRLGVVAEHVLERRVRLDDPPARIGEQHPGDRARERRLEPCERSHLAAPGVELRRAADRGRQRDREQLERLTLLVAEPVVEVAAHDVQRGDRLVAREQRHADQREVADALLHLLVDPRVADRVADQQRVVRVDRMPDDRSGQRPAFVQQLGHDAARAGDQELVSLDQADDRAVRAGQRHRALDDEVQHRVQIDARRGDVAQGLHGLGEAVRSCAAAPARSPCAR